LQRSSVSEESVARWALLLEYPLLRLQRRLDVVLLCGQRVVVVEFKVGASTYSAVDARQAEDYALDLRDFHEASHKLNIIPVLCAIEAPAAPFTLDKAPGVAPLCRCNRATLSSFFSNWPTPTTVRKSMPKIGTHPHIGQFPPLLKLLSCCMPVIKLQRLLTPAPILKT
jgi:hypothetical protein